MSGGFIHIGLPLLLSLTYLGLLTQLSKWAQSSARAASWVKHPLMFGLALGVYASTWTFYGSVGFATHYGFGFAAISLGVVLSCLAIPVLWAPLSRVVRAQRLSSVADLFAHRFQSRAVGVVVTAFLLAGLLPYVALQLRAIGDAALALAGGHTEFDIGACYTVLLIVFAAFVGPHFTSPWGSQSGLLAVLAGETLSKVLALLVVGGHALYSVLGGPAALGAHLQAHPELLDTLYTPVHHGLFPALIACSFVAAFLLPRQFHVAFVAQPSPRALRHASWTLPLVLLLLNLPLPVLWIAGQHAAPPGTPPDLYVLLVSASPSVRSVAFLGGVSAASAMILTSTIALGGMVVNHIWQPFARSTELIARTPVVRRGVVLLVIASAFVLNMWMPRRGTLVEMGLLSFVALLQLAPGLAATLFWERASRAGFLWGLGGGVATWVTLTWLPLLGYAQTEHAIAELLGLAPDLHGLGIWLSLALNAGLLVLGSLLVPASHRELVAAASCRARPNPLPLTTPPESVDALEQRIAEVLGDTTAQREVERAREQLGVPADEHGMWPLLQLAERTQRNLAETLGPLRARMVVVGSGQASTPTLLGPQLLWLEERMASAETDGTAMQEAYAFVLRALGDLPVGLCALDGIQRIAVWNQALVAISGISRERALGAQAEDLTEPFCTLLQNGKMGSREEVVTQDGVPRVLRIHRSHFAVGALVIFEDLTEEKALRDSLAHHDRLASLGQLAAGVAHEIGNPLAGLLMVASNLREELDQDDAPARLQAIIREGKRIEGIVHTLLDFCHRGRGEQKRALASLSDIIEEAAQLVALGRPGGSALIEHSMTAQDLHANVDRQALVQVLVNLLGNALDASPTGCPVTLQAGRTQTELYVDVEDQGPGVDPNIEPLLFTPFITTKDPGRGTGLGLAVSLRIAQDHGGALSYRRTPQGTTCFRLTLPATASLGAAL